MDADVLLLMEGAFGDVALWDVGIIAATVVVGLVVFAVIVPWPDN